MRTLREATRNSVGPFRLVILGMCGARITGQKSGDVFDFYGEFMGNIGLKAPGNYSA